MTKGSHILLVGDDDINAMTVYRALRELKSEYALDHVTDGEKALAYLQDPANLFPELILLDINMPRMNGIEFLKIIKADPKLKMIPVVMLTSSEEESDRNNSFSQSVAGFMVKPVDYPQFVNVMQLISNYWVCSKSATL
jgi:CheY-like chemotaxis protein